MLRRNQGMNPRPRDCVLRPGSHSLQGKVYDVTGNKMYQPGNSYNGKPTHASCNPHKSRPCYPSSRLALSSRFHEC
jgi:hypothetical protein